MHLMHMHMHMNANIDTVGTQTQQSRANTSFAPTAVSLDMFNQRFPIRSVN